jgi:putative membrane protein
MFLESLLVTLHVFANVVWIGSIAAVGWLAWKASATADSAAAKTTAELAVALYKRIAVPAFAASFTFGVVRLLLAPGAYMQLHWFHGKLTFALAVIALHHIIGARAKRAASGSMQAGKSGAILVVALLVCAFLSVTFVVFKTQLVP